MEEKEEADEDDEDDEGDEDDEDDDDDEDNDDDDTAAAAAADAADTDADADAADADADAAADGCAHYPNPTPCATYSSTPGDYGRRAAKAARRETRSPRRRSPIARTAAAPSQGAHLATPRRVPSTRPTPPSRPPRRACV